MDNVSSEKDIDGFHPINIGKLTKRNQMPNLIACTPMAIMELLKLTGIELEGKSAVVVGRSDIVGIPVMHLLNKKNCTVILTHSKTKNLPDIIRQADVLVAAIGKAEFIKGEWIKQGCIVIDVGMNAKEDLSKKVGYRWVGDVDFEQAKLKASFITPVPGGVGPMTVACLMMNLVKAYELNLLKKLPKFIPISLDILNPVPSDIAIVENHKPKKISQMILELGLKDNEYEPHGHYITKLQSETILKRLYQNKQGNYVVISGINPTPLGEGKSTLTIGLAQSLQAHLNIPTIAVIRQPSQGPTFGIKGGAAGGGYSQVMPMVDFNLHFTGDIHAITAANNLVAAAIDIRIFHEKTQSDLQLFNRLCPKTSNSRQFSSYMLNRAKDLGINLLQFESQPDFLEIVKKLVRLDFDVNQITWKRVLDINDRFLRKIKVGLSKTESKANYQPETGFDITVASELMAILGLSSSLKDLKYRLKNIVIGQSIQGIPITTDDLGISGALLLLLKKAFDPNLIQTLEGTPVLVHTGPFANIAHGSSSIIADLLALKLVSQASELGFVITEAGFGADIGLEKFLNIKLRSNIAGIENNLICGKLKVPDMIVLCITIRALKLHGGGPSVIPGKSLSQAYLNEDLDLVKNGLPILQYHINLVTKKFGINCIVAINRFSSDSEQELEIVKIEAIKFGALDALVCNNWAEGGKGALDLAKSIKNLCSASALPTIPNWAYELNDSLTVKIEKLAKIVYGFNGIVNWSDIAKSKRNYIEANNQAKWLPICVAKTQYSITPDPLILNDPKLHSTEWGLTIIDLKWNNGAKFITLYLGDIQTLPGLPTHPSYMDMDWDLEQDKPLGLF